MHKGDVVTDFELPDETGAPRRLAELLADGPVVLFFYPAALSLQEQLKPSNGGVFLGLNGIVIKSHAGSTPRVSQTLSIWLPKMALQELHSKVKQTIASAVRRRGNKRRTLWRGVTTKLGQP